MTATTTANPFPDVPRPAGACPVDRYRRWTLVPLWRGGRVFTQEHEIGKALVQRRVRGRRDPICTSTINKPRV